MGELGFSSVAHTVNVAPFASGHALFLETVVTAVEMIFGRSPFSLVVLAVWGGSAPDISDTVDGIGSTRLSILLTGMRVCL